MKKSLFVIILIMTLVVSVYGANVIDEADILLEYEEQELNEALEILRDSYEFDAVILTVNTLNGRDIFSFSDDYYDNNNYGIGENHDGLIFVLALEEREFATSTCGRAIPLFHDRLLDDIHDDITPYLSDGNYREAFEQYIGAIERMILLSGSTSCDVAYGDDSNLYEVQRGTNFYVTFEIIVIIAALIIGWIVVAVMKAPMKNIGIKKNADSYTDRDNFLITRSIDRFMYSSITKTRINNDNNRSSTRTSSSGRSHGGRSGSF